MCVNLPHLGSKLPLSPYNSNSLVDKLINPIIYIYIYKEFHVEGGMNIPHNLTTDTVFLKRPCESCRRSPFCGQHAKRRFDRFGSTQNSYTMGPN